MEPDEDVFDVGQRRYEQEDSVFSYKSCTVVTLNDAIMGMLVAFPIVEPSTDTSDVDPVLVPYRKLEEANSYYICDMSLFPEFRGQGIGSQLLALAEKQALEKGFNKLSLLVFEQNVGAKKLYDRAGFKEVAREPVIPNRLLQYTGDVILMVKGIT